MAYQPATEEVPVFSKHNELPELWKSAAEVRQPLVAIRDGERGFIVTYTLMPARESLTSAATRRLRNTIADHRDYDTTSVDPISHAELLGGEVRRESGRVHAETMDEARDISASVIDILFSQDNYEDIPSHNY